MSANIPRSIIVLGAERSGTSVVAEMIHRWGAYAGEADKLSPPSEHSPRGQWEYEPLWDLLADIGDFANGHTWWDPEFEKRIEAKLELPEYRNKARALVAEMEREPGPWMWKDPALCHFLPFWKPIWGDVVYVITVRHPYDVAHSWQRMTVPSELRATVDRTRCNLLRWQHMMLMVLRSTTDTDRKLFVEYERLVENRVAEATRLARFLDDQCGRELSDEATIRAMAATINPSLRRNRFEQPLLNVPDSTPDQHALYEFLKRKVDDSSARFIDAYPMPSDWWRFVHESEAVVRNQ